MNRMVLKRPTAGQLAKRGALVIAAVLIGIAALIAGFVFLLFAGNQLLEPDRRGLRAFHERVAEFAGANLDPIPLHDLFEHDVSSVCPMYQYALIRDVAEEMGVDADALPNVTVRESAYGFLIVGSGTVSYAELYDEQYASDPGRECLTGTELALIVDSVDPITGARFVDLAADGAN